MDAGTKPEIPMRNEREAMLLRFHKISFAAATLLAAAVSPQAFAQSTGTDAIEEVVVTATKVRQIGLAGDQTAPKSRISLTSEYLATQPAGQTIF